MGKLEDLAWGKEIHLGVDLNGKPTEENDVNDQPTPMVKCSQAREYAQWLPNFECSILRSF